MRTVRDFKNYVDRVTNGEFPRSNDPSTMDRGAAFWEKLNRLGARNIKRFPPEAVPDIDATVRLSDKEWQELETEFLVEVLKLR